MTARGAWGILAWALLCASASAQQAPAASHVTGVVLDARTDTAIRRARVEVAVISTRYPPVFTDERGGFSIDVPVGMSLTITKAGFAPESVKTATTRGSEPAAIRVSMNRAAAITGHLIDASGTPLMNMSVALREAATARAVESSRPRTTSTNDLGEFRFGGLTTGEFALASPVATASVRVRPGDTVDVGDVVYERSPTASGVAARATDIRKRPAIAGTVSDEYGDPLQGAMIRLLQIRRAGDRLAAIAQEHVGPRMSDDRGAYRIFGLPAGRYLVVADVEGYAPAYYSGVTNIAYALPVVVVDRGDAEGIDFAFRRERTVRVFGTALDSSGKPVRGAVLLGVSQRAGGVVPEPRVAPVAPDGSFAFDSVAPGDYVLQVSAPYAGLLPKVEGGKLLTPRMEFGMQRLVVGDTDLPAVSLRTSLGATLRGRIAADGQTPPPRSLAVFPYPTDFDLSLMMAGGGGMGLTKSDDGSFVVTGVTGPRRFAMVSAPDGWYVKDVRVRGVDALDTPFDFGLKDRDFDDIDVVVSPAGAAVSGTVTRPTGDPVADYSVLVFSTDTSKWYQYSQSVKLGRPTEDPAFRIGGLPPGSYDVLAMNAASDVIDSGDWQDPGTLEKLRALATRVTVGEGETRTITLRLTSLP